MKDPVKLPSGHILDRDSSPRVEGINLSMDKKAVIIIEER